MDDFDVVDFAPRNERDIHTITVLAFFEDPGLEQALKSLLQRNRHMLVKYEEKIPSWTVTLAQYTGYYRPWMRHLVKAIAFVASLITMFIGFYDLYKHFPIFSSFINAYAESW